MPTKDKICSKAQAKLRIENWKDQNQKIVFTNGCFDLLHIGHVDYLEKAAAKGNKLVVGVNTDASVNRLKGPSRPIKDQYNRTRILAALAFVDLVVLFDEPTPLELITHLCPDILIKGADYQIDNIVGAEYVLKNGGKVETIELVKGYSTSNIINKIIQFK